MFSSIRTWGKMTWPLTVAFVSVISAVLIVVIGVSFQDRPAAAPQTGQFDLGFEVIGAPKLHSRYCGFSYDLRLQCSWPELSFGYCRDEKTAGLQEGCLPSGRYRRIRLPFFLHGHLLLLWKMDCYTFSWQCWAGAQEGRVWCCISESDRQRWTFQPQLLQIVSI